MPVYNKEVLAVRHHIVTKTNQNKLTHDTISDETRFHTRSQSDTSALCNLDNVTVELYYTNQTDTEK